MFGDQKDWSCQVHVKADSSFAIWTIVFLGGGGETRQTNCKGEQVNLVIRIHNYLYTPTPITCRKLHTELLPPLPLFLLLCLTVTIQNQ